MRSSIVMRVAALAAVAASVACGASGPPRLSSAPLDSSWSSPARPRMPTEADTNSADTYEQWGLVRVAFSPDSAAAAFHWAARLDPWRASSYYERSIALVLSLAERPSSGAFTLPWVLTRRLSAAQLEMVDSLNELAMLRDPFLERTLDTFLSGSPPLGIVERMRDPAQRGYWLFTLRKYDSAVVDLGRALQKTPNIPALRVMRAAAFYHLREYDSTAAELETLLKRLSAIEEKELVVYRSKAMIHYAIGIALVQKDDPRAREHFEAALVEDLSFYMARVRLVALDLQRADTTAALASLAQAIDVKNDDPALHYFHGLILQRRDPVAAEKAFARAVALDPYFAPPQLQLAVMADLRGDTTTALAAYDRFLSLAAKSDPVLMTARARRAILAPAGSTP